MNSVTGTLKIKDKTFSLSNAVALLYDGKEGLLDKPELRVVLSDTAIDVSSSTPLHYAYDIFGSPLTTQARANKIHGLIFILNPQEKNTMHGILLYPPEDAQSSLVNFSYNGTEPAFQKLEITDAVIKGQINYKGPMGFEEEFECQLSFEVDIKPEDPATELNGEKAFTSAPAQAFQAFEQAACQADFTKIQALVAPEKYQSLEMMRSQAGEEQCKQMLKMFCVTPEQLKQQTDKVLIRGKRAWILGELNGDKLYQSVIEQDGKWIIV